MNAIRILHLEDNPADAELIRIILQDDLKIPQVLQTSSKAEYIKLLAEHEFDLILSDYNVPQFEGTESLTLAKKGNELVPFIYVTGALGEKIATELLRNGATDYVLKENLEKLPFAIKRAIDEARQKKEKLAAELELKLRDHAISNAGVGVLMARCCDEGAKIIYTNKHVSKIIAYSEEEILGNSLTFLFGEESDQATLNEVIDVLDNHREFSGEIVCHKKDGSSFWGDLTITPVFESGVQSHHYIIVLKDVSEQKALEYKIWQNNKLFEEIQNVANIGLWNYDPETDMMTVSTEVAKLLGEIQTFSTPLQNVLKFVRKDFYELAESSIKKAILWRTKWDIDFVLKSPTGDERWIRQIGYPVLKENKVVQLRGLIMDNHGKKMAEIKAQQSLAFSDLIFNSVNDLICLHEPDGTYTKISPSIKRITGYTPQELEGKKPFDFIHPEDLEKLMADGHVPFLSTKMDNTQIEYRFKNKSGQYLWFLTNTVGIFNENGVLTQMVTSSVDITDRKRNSLALKQEHMETLKYQCMLLSTQINPHFIFNSLNAVQYYILDQNVEPAIQFISDFSTLMRGVLANSMKNYIPLKEEVDWLDKYLRLERARFSDKFDYKIEISDEIEIDDTMIPTMLLQPFVENAIIHGVGPLKNNGRVNISLRKENELIISEIDDNGVGRKKGDQLKKLREEVGKHKSFGVSITRTKIELLNELEGGIFQYEVIDKQNADGSPAGTRVIIRYPESLSS